MEKHDVVAISWPMGMAYLVEKDNKLYFWQQLLSVYRQELKDILDTQWYYNSPKEPPNQLKLEFE